MLPEFPFNLEKAVAHCQSLFAYVVVTHGRSGLSFFKRIFDQHPQILTIPIVFYEYHDLRNLFAQQEYVSGQDAYDWALTRSQFSCLVGPLTDEIRKKFIAMGDDPDAQMDRELARKVLQSLLLEKKSVNRKDVLIAIHISYAAGVGRDIFAVKALLLAETVTKPSDDFFVQQSMEDFTECFILHLVRDPRASYSSSKNVYGNSYGSLYPLRSFMSLYAYAKTNAVWLWAMLKLYTGAKIMRRIRFRLGENHFFIVRNEDLNLDFLPSMKKLISQTQLPWDDAWSNPNYHPTAMGKPWKGFSAYSNISERENNGATASQLKGDQRYGKPDLRVTENWKRFLNKNEIILVENVFSEEMSEFGYQRQFQNGNLNFWLRVFLPVLGEFPGLKWLSSIRKTNFIKDFIIRISYYPLLPLFYIWARIIFFYQISFGGLRHYGETS